MSGDGYLGNNGKAKSFRPRCSCGNLCKTNGYRKNGTVKYQKICSPCAKAIHKESKMSLKFLKKDKCENCGFKPIHLCQLDVDHINGDRGNSEPSNLMTLCANCHRLKTYMNKDWEKSNELIIDKIEIQISLF